VSHDDRVKLREAKHDIYDNPKDGGDRNEYESLLRWVRTNRSAYMTRRAMEIPTEFPDNSDRKKGKKGVRITYREK
jgi:hypothetical protein